MRKRPELNVSSTGATKVLQMLISLEELDLTNDRVGGKALTLAKLLKVGLPVPRGMVLSTCAYREFVDSNDLHRKIAELSIPDAQSRSLVFENGEQQITKLFENGTLPNSVMNRLSEAYELIGANGPVAVRSSGTAEDLELSSFAGQHRTFLNVVGIDALVQAVVGCWASLWSSTAMAYRYRLGLRPGEVAMAVVIQEMVPSEVSGVAFTADPTSGNKSKIFVNASFGLGEALVSGKVNPDLFVIDRETQEIVEYKIHNKLIKVIPNDKGGVSVIDVGADKKSTASMTSADLQRLTRLALQTEAAIGNKPQDLEWALSEGEIHILQSRPITSLPPIPTDDVKWDPPDENALILRHQLVEHIPGPVCTLFEETYLRVGLQEAWGRNLAKNYPKTYRFEHSQPPWSFIVHPTVNGYAYKRVGTPKPPPGVKPRRNLKNPWIRRLLWWRAMFRQRERWLNKWKNQALPTYNEIRRKWEPVDETKLESNQLLNVIWLLARCEADHWFNGIYFGVALTRNHEIRLNQFFEKFAKEEGFVSSQLLTGFDSYALRAQRDLFDMAKSIRSHESLFRSVLREGPTRFRKTLEQEANPGILKGLEKHITTYGKQIYTLDFVEPTPVEDPSPIYENLFALVIDDEYDFYEQQSNLKNHRQEAIRRISSHFGPVRRLQFHRLLRRAQRDYHLREEALFYLGHVWPTLRRMALELGRRLVNHGHLEYVDDIFYLNTGEISSAIDMYGRSSTRQLDLKKKSKSRKLLRESRKFLTPPLRIGRDPNFPDPPTQEDFGPNLFKGSAVSPGVVEAQACVICDTKEFGSMKPGAILVCPTTTPAWTPLFPHATGLVTDIGGLLAHGSIVAREYGIPAVLGLGDATRKIKTGDLLTVDGDAGTVKIHKR